MKNQSTEESKIRLLLAFGGESAEHEVSVASAGYVYGLLNKERYDVTLSYVDRRGCWWKVDTIEDEPKQLNNELRPSLGRGEFIDSQGERLKPTVILPIMLGPNGEDGSVQALAQLLHIPIVGCGILGSAICMDKDVTKRLLLQARVPVADYILHHSADPDLDFNDVKKQLGEIVFIKPANLGSSVGVSRADSAETFARGLAEAHKHDNKVLIERAVIGREVGCGVIGNEHPETSVVSEIKVSGAEFFTYDAKYSAESTTQVIIPADLPEEVSDKVRRVAAQAYTALECRGLARVDLFLTDDGEVYVNELNTLPAFRGDSSYPKLWKATGVDPSTLWDKIIDFSLR